MLVATVCLGGVMLFIALFTLIGLNIRRGGMRPIVEGEVEEDGQRLASLPDGRRVAYCTYGIQDPAAPVVINIHGSGLEAGFERGTHGAVCTALGCRGIAISLPGYGFTDEKPGRQVKDWPREDLAAVLEAEGVSDFHITGHSQGTPHAMAAALVYPDRCIGLGLNAPLLPTALCDALGIERAIGTGTTPTSTQLRGIAMAWYFTLMTLLFRVLPPRVLSSLITRGFPKVQADHELLARFEGSMVRSVVRGTRGAVWETAQDTCFDWGFDVREVQNSNAVVWHAEDDSAIPAAQGKWLAAHLGARQRHAPEGYGHMTYCAGQYLAPERSLVAACLRGAKQGI